MFRRPLRYYYLRLMRQHGSPEHVAAGMAIGLFLALAIPPGLGLVVLAAVLFFFNVNRFAAILGCAITNPLTMPAIYYFEYRVGRLITGIEPERFPTDRAEFWDLLTNYERYGSTLLVLGVGALTTAVFAAVIGYLVTRPLVAAYQRRRAARAARRRLELERLEAERDALRGDLDVPPEP